MPLTILIADDDIGTRLAISDYLDLSGYHVITADNGIDALNTLEKYHPDLLVTDIMMPLMNGYELVRRVRQLSAFRLLPVILLTARTKIQERILGYQSGCDLYLPKPFELEELAAAIRNLLERSQIIQSECRFIYQDNNRNLTYTKAENGHISVSTQVQISQVLTPLTVREKEVLDLLTHGFSNVEIGNHLHLSPRTVEKYVSSLLRKTETSNRAELVRFAIKHDLVE
ncbi:MAG: response regulator transcription factor [Dolichospermum sp.]|jgi:DNA-binding NarL/FixJ family response regulator|uniref:response regulator transcription factor n=1 Tax=Dolichospermum circinale TaxID=109265 RepID=UPI00042081B6|nr:response regulator transcription factor [Dolichospermum circinale]MCE2721283.1 response regulator transcription factor [Anabaena sp. 49628_E55]MDB9484521.1 response regulator transcription factor [Dolichospermum circinale CS-537/05]MDB9455148.1 response regulator transcription factor [Dolichospermum circinale CS-541/06]MDB9461533.1 response regulator transcription factor [Dolichospermum circinale CS-541/04]MDB9474005.1 response regulator transcription factor [Dolichospermum circinale CS-537